MFKRTRSENEWHDYVEERLSAYIDGQLPENERAQVRQHLATCQRCQASLNSLTWTIKLLKQAPAPALPRQFTLPVRETAPARNVGAPAWLKWGLTAAASAAALVGVIFVALSYLAQGQGGAELAARPQAQSTMAAFGGGGGAQATTAPSGGYLAPAATNAPAATSAPAATMAASDSSTAATSGGGGAAGGTAATAAPQPTQASLSAPPRRTRGTRTAVPPAPTETSVTALQQSPTTALPSTGGGGGGGGGIPPNAGGAIQPTPTVPTIRAATSPEGSSVPEIPITGTVKADLVNVRSGPGLEYAPVGLVRNGEKLQVFGRDETGNWLQILFPLDNTLNQRGWIFAEFVELPTPIGDLRIEPTPTPTPSPTPTLLAP